MQLLLVNAAFLDGLGALMGPLKEQSILLLFLFYFFLFLAALTLMSMLIGVVCEVVSAVATMEKETLTVNYTRDRLQELLALGVDVDNDKRISKEEFLHMFTIPEAVEILHEIDVDVIGLLDFSETIFEPDVLDLEKGVTEERTLDFGEFMRVVLDLRGNNPATVRDVVETRKSVNNRIRHMDKRLNGICPSPASGPKIFSEALQDAPKFGIDVDSKLAQQLHGLVSNSVLEIVKTLQNECASQHAENSQLVSALREENNELRQELGSKRVSSPANSSGSLSASGSSSTVASSSANPCGSLPGKSKRTKDEELVEIVETENEHRFMCQ
jgi:hypothetical protein